MDQVKKVAVVTGAAEGIGFAGAEKFASENYAVALLDRNEEKLSEAVESLKARGYDVEGWTVDVADYTAGKAVIRAVAERFGRIDALFNNAGIIGTRGSILSCDPEKLQQATEVNVFGSFYMIRDVAEIMIEKEIKGSIVNVTSIAAELASWDPTGYQISKYGVKGLTKVAAFQLGNYGIRVNAVGPGMTKTSMSRMDWSNPEIKAQWEEWNLLHKVMEPKEIAEVAFFLSSDAASAVTGQIVLADAGYTVTKVSNRGSIYGE